MIRKKYKNESNEMEMFTPEEIAILEFTNDGDFDPRILRHETRNFGQQYILTGKESYFWAVALAIVVERYDHIDEQAIYFAYTRAVEENIYLLKEKYQSPSLNFHDNVSDKFIFEKLIRSFMYNLDCAQIELEEIVERTNYAFKRLVERGLIEDPIEIAAGSVAIAVLGFIPYGFTTKTRRGRVVYRKISAPYWTYERKKIRNEQVSTFNIRLVKFLSALKKALIEVSQDKVDGDE